MSDATEKRFREVFTYQLRPYLAHQDGRNTNAPALLFADADFAIGDGNTFIHEDDKQASEPAIIYVRADALLNALARAEKAEVALREIARQKKTNELETEYDVECASFEDDFDLAVDRARAALAELTGDKRCMTT